MVVTRDDPTQCRFQQTRDNFASSFLVSRWPSHFDLRVIPPRGDLFQPDLFMCYLERMGAVDGGEKCGIDHRDCIHDTEWKACFTEIGLISHGGFDYT